MILRRNDTAVITPGDKTWSVGGRSLVRQLEQYVGVARLVERAPACEIMAAKGIDVGLVGAPGQHVGISELVGEPSTVARHDGRGIAVDDWERVAVDGWAGDGDGAGRFTPAACPAQLDAQRTPFEALST